MKKIKILMAVILSAAILVPITGCSASADHTQKIETSQTENIDQSENNESYANNTASDNTNNSENPADNSGSSGITYTNTAIDYAQFDCPSIFKPNDDARAVEAYGVTNLVTANQDALLQIGYVNLSINNSAQTPQEAVNKIKNEHNTSFAEASKNSYTASWIEGDKIIYHYVLFNSTNNFLVQMFLQYPSNQKDKYDPIIKKMHDSFKANFPEVSSGGGNSASNGQSTSSNDDNPPEWQQTDEEIFCYSRTEPITEQIMNSVKSSPAAKKATSSTGQSLPQMMINEIYARHGYEFKDPKVKKYFESRKFYKNLHKTEDQVKKEFAPVEKQNIDFLKACR